MTSRDASRGFWTIPNVISFLRLLGLPPLLWAAWEGNRVLFLVITVLLLASDWLDGKLAVALDQRTVLGARLDSLMDALMYGALGLGLFWLEGDVVRRYLLWFLGAAGSWFLSVAIGLARFGKLPSYHSRGAKVSWFAVAVATLVLLLLREPRPIPWVLTLVILTNLEAAAIGLVLPLWKADVSGLFEALDLRREKNQPADSNSLDAPES